MQMRGWAVDTPKESIIPQLPTTLMFGFCFLAGWFWHRHPQLLGILARRWKWHLAGAVLVWVRGTDFRPLRLGFEAL